MDKALREQFNQHFTESKYTDYLKQLDSLFPGAIDFRVAETPVFIPKTLKHQMLDTCEAIIDFIKDPSFKSLTERSIPTHLNVPNEDEHPQMLVFDFGICENKQGEWEPQLIEMQGFPSLYAFEFLSAPIAREYASIPPSFDSFLNGYDANSYKNLLQSVIVGNHAPEQVVLLEIHPEHQKTRIDFHCTEKLLGIQPLCITQLIREGLQLYYEKDGKKIRIRRIYNRVIFDDLQQQESLDNLIDITAPYEVEWAPHPNWFYRISKFTLPFIQHPFVPITYFLNELSTPLPWEDYVLKPLFSFAGMGVLLEVTQEDIDKIPDPENWIVQKKVNYAPVVQTLDEPAKAEIRLFYFWDQGWSKPVAVHNLARLSKGKMIGTRYNQDKTWVGGTIAFFEKD